MTCESCRDADVYFTAIGTPSRVTAAWIFPPFHCILFPWESRLQPHSHSTGSSAMLASAVRAPWTEIGEGGGGWSGSIRARRRFAFAARDLTSTGAES